MITANKFRELQQLFFTKVTACCNPSTVTLKFIKTVSTGRFTDFVGDGLRSVDKEVVLKCFYMRNISDKQRENIGVTQDVTDIVYISPLDLKKHYGSNQFPDYVRSAFSDLSVSFLGKHYEILNIIDLEPMQMGKEYVCLAYQLNLKTSTGNKNID